MAHKQKVVAILEMKLEKYEKKVYSQNGEDGIIDKIFSIIGTTNKYAVEFGVETGIECNTRFLRERKGWTCLLMDGNAETEFVKKEHITAENINSIFKKYNVPNEFDLLSIDIDGNDYWIWKAIDSIHIPRVVVIEYNASILVTESKTIAYDPQHLWRGTDYFGASLLALVKLGKIKGYTLVGCDSTGSNSFFIKDELIAGKFQTKDISELYNPPRYRTITGHHPIGVGNYVNV